MKHKFINSASRKRFQQKRNPLLLALIAFIAMILAIRTLVRMLLPRKVTIGKTNQSNVQSPPVYVYHRPDVLDATVREQPEIAVKLQALPVNKTFILVPFAKDGSYFNPSLCRPKARTFTVGEKGSEVRFDTFEAALEHLRSMPVAMWRRPNPYNVKNWGIVSAIRWGFLPENYL